MPGPTSRWRGASDDPPDRPRVWRATRLADDRTVAIKVFPAGRAGLARREAALLSAVDHPHLLALLEVVGTAEHVGLVTPFAAGGSLAALLVRRGRLTWPETLTVLIPLADALAAADERELVHGDLSAGNVLFDAAGRPLLADLGAARAAAEWSQPVAVTPTDVAPEVARGSPPDHRSDLFSLGSIALHCLSGRPAWPAETVTDALIQSTLGQWPDPEFVIAPDDLLAVVRRLLDPEPGRRGSAAALAVDLRRVGEPAPVDLSERTADGRPRLPATQIRPDAPALRAASATRRRRAGWRRWRRRARSSRRLGRRSRSEGRRSRKRRASVARRRAPVGTPRAAGPGRRTAGRGTDSRRSGPPRRPVPRIRNAVIGVLAVLALGAGAVRVGLWWAGSGQVDPPTVASIPATSPHGAVDDRIRCGVRPLGRPESARSVGADEPGGLDDGRGRTRCRPRAGADRAGPRTAGPRLRARGDGARRGCRDDSTAPNGRLPTGRSGTRHQLRRGASGWLRSRTDGRIR